MNLHLQDLSVDRSAHGAAFELGFDHLDSRFGGGNLCFRFVEPGLGGFHGGVAAREFLRADGVLWRSGVSRKVEIAGGVIEHRRRSTFTWLSATRSSVWRAASSARRWRSSSLNSGSPAFTNWPAVNTYFRHDVRQRRADGDVFGARFHESDGGDRMRESRHRRRPKAARSARASAGRAAPRRGQTSMPRGR